MPAHQGKLQWHNQMLPQLAGGYLVLTTSRLSSDSQNLELDLWDPVADQWTLLSAYQYGPEAPDNDGRHVTWSAFPDDSMAWQKDIYLYDTENGVARRIVDNPAMQLGSTVDQGRVVWGDKRTGNWDIYMYDSATDAETCICCDPHDQTGPFISGNLVVWSDWRFSGSSQDALGKNDLYLHDLDTGVGRRITTESQTFVFGRKVSQGRLAYLVKGAWSDAGLAGYVIDLGRAGFLDASGHVIPE